MLFLYQLGMAMEPQLGRGRFALLYFASLLGGSAGVLVVDQKLFNCARATGDNCRARCKTLVDLVRDYPTPS